MRRRLFVFLALVPFAATAASAQVIRGVGFGVSSGATASATVEEMVARVMSFDHDGDGVVGRGELNDRMRPLMDRGDRDGNGALDRAEVRALASAPPPSLSSSVAGHYGFGDQIGFSSRAHIEGAIQDLRLDTPTRDRALSVANAFVDALETDRSSAFLASAEPWVMPEQLDTLAAAVTRADATRMVFADRQAPGAAGTVSSARSLLNQFKLPPLHHDAMTEAIAEYAASLGVGEAERLALVRELEGVLDDEERANLRAALDRRPVVSTGAVMFVQNGKVLVFPQGPGDTAHVAPVFIDSPTASR